MNHPEPDLFRSRRFLATNAWRLFRSAGLLPLLAAAHADILFEDTFDRAASRNIQETLDGITNQTGSVLNSGGDPDDSPVYFHGHIDPASSFAGGFGTPDAEVSNGGSARIITNPSYAPGIVSGTTLELAAEAAGSSNAIVNHNFVNDSILAAGGFSVSLDIITRGGDNTGQGGGFAIGMSLAEALSSGDALHTSASPLTGGFGSAIGEGTVVSGGVVSDFWIVLRSSGALVWGAGPGTTGIHAVAAGGDIPLNPGGKLIVNFRFDDFNAGSTVNYEIFYDGISRGSGAFVWSGTDENYIGLEGRNSNGVNLDNFRVATDFFETADLHWSADAGSGDFFDAGNWLRENGQPFDPPRFPQGGDFAFIGSGAVVDLGLGSEGHALSGGIRVGIQSPSWATSGNASLNISGAGTFTSPQIHAGHGTTGDGTLAVAAGSTVVTGNPFWVGRAGGKGNLDVSGTIRVADTGNRIIEIGHGRVNVAGEGDPEQWVASEGTATLREGGKIENVQRLFVGRDGGNATFDIHGTITVPAAGERNIEIGHGTGGHANVTLHPTGQLLELQRFWVGLNDGTGIFTLDGGTIVKQGGSSVIIGQAGGNGTFHHESGSFTLNNNLLVGNQGNATGVYNMRGGQLTVTGTGAGDNAGLAIGRTDGTHGNGTFNISGGTVTTTPVRIGGGGANSESTGHLAITGGDLRVRRIFGGTGTSSALFNGGKITVTGASTAEEPFIQGIRTATVGANGLNIDTNGFDIHLSQRFGFTGNGVIAFSNSGTSPGTAAFHGLQEGDENEATGYAIRIGSRVTVDIPIGGAENRDLIRPLDGSGSLVKSGTGTLNLIENDYTGDTTVAGGTLALVKASLGDVSTVSVAAGAQLYLFHSQTDVVGALFFDGQPQSPGVYHQGNSGGFITGNGSLHVIAPPPPAGFQGFIDGYTELDEEEKAADADPDGDGIPNLLEYALGLDPTAPESLPSLDGNTITFAKGALAVGNGDVTYIIETSPTLGAEPTPWAAVTPAVNTDEEISYTLPAASPESPRNFVRLRVELAE